MDIIQNKQWIKPPEHLRLSLPYIQATLLKQIDPNYIECQIKTQRGPLRLQVAIAQSYEIADDNQYEDMCLMNILNEPQVLNNIVKRYNKDEIFTSIGSTLILVNPYRIIKDLFSQELFESIKTLILNNQLKDQSPHIYVLAGKAYLSMLETGNKQAIVISGQSGAGKTQSTKYCMKMLTSFNNNPKDLIQQKILACNPVLEAFGNSKTVRNQNSSRFGKFVRIFFDESNIIRGATIKSYLLQKSRVISISKNQRTFHSFYAVVASGLYKTLKRQNYSLLKQSQCYESTYTNDAEYFNEINIAFQKIGFFKPQVDSIWQLIVTILSLGNIDFDEMDNLLDQSKTCTLTKCNNIAQIARLLKTEEQSLRKILLFERKKFLKEYTLCPYSKQACINNRNVLCKAIYNAIFQFILQKIQITLIPSHQYSSLKEINILDIFGFENFQENSFEQLCINFANEKLLKLYNNYVFDREILILKEDGLQQQILGITPPANQEIINTLNGKLSVFSIINDMTLPQCRQEDMIQGFKKVDTKLLKINKTDKLKFIIEHSQCDVQYQITGFKMKNQDKTNEDVNQLINKLFLNDIREQTGKTILNKFTKQIDDLISQLTSSNVHFIRCIKPNQEKQPNSPNEKYILTQIRYLGIFQTIIIRKNIYPYRKTYRQFRREFILMFPNIKSVKNEEQSAKLILKQLSSNQRDYLFGNHRIYLNTKLQQLLNKKIYDFLKLRNQSVKRIQRSVRKWIFRKRFLSNLKVLYHRIIIFKDIPRKLQNKFLLSGMMKIVDQARAKKLKQEQDKEILRFLKLKEAKKLRQLQEQHLKEERRLKELQNIELFVSKLQKMLNNSHFNILNETINQLSYFLREQLSIKSEPESMIMDKPVMDKSRDNQLQISLQESNFNILEMIQNYQEINLNKTHIKDNYSPYKKPQTPSSIMGETIFFNSSFVSVLHKDPTIADYLNATTCAFQGQVKLQGSYTNHSEIEKLKNILTEQQKILIEGNEQDFFSPPSIHTKFTIQDLPQEILNLIIDFPLQFFFDKILRNRTNFIGYKKSFKDILVCKKSVLNKSMTILENKQDEKKALHVFKLLLKIGDEFKIENVLKYVEKVVTECAESSNQLKEEIFVQFIRQVCTDHELTAIRIYQTMAVFLHIYSPADDMLKATLSLLYWKYQQKKKRTTEYEYMLYVFSIIIQKLKKKTYIGYLPINYQIMGVMCKRQISIPVYLSIGNSIIIRVQSFNNFADIKEKAMKAFYININRFKPQYFTFFQVINFNNEQLEENPIKESSMVWDMITYWQITKKKYLQCSIKPPNFFLMLKIRYAFECHEEDEEAIELYYAQLYFDFFMGKVRLDNHIILYMGSIIRLIKFKDQPLEDIYFGLIPAWMLKWLTKEEILKLFNNIESELKEKPKDVNRLKFEIIKICQQCDLTLAMNIPTEQPCEYKLYLKNKTLILVDKQGEKECISLKRLVKWKIQQTSFDFEAFDKSTKQNKMYSIKTSYASICNQFLKNIPLTKSKNQDYDFKKK